MTVFSHRNEITIAPSSASTRRHDDTDTMATSSSSKKQQLHISSVKTFIAITACGCLAFVPTIVVSWYFPAYIYWSYLYFVNHVNNPFIYVAFNRRFRSDAFSLASKLDCSGCFR